MQPNENLSIVEARNIGRRSPGGSQWLLKEVSLAVRPGDRLALAGPSGAGKTLLLRALAMLDPLDAGEVRWHGCPIQPPQVPLFRADVIYLHQRAAIIQATVEDSLRQPFALRIRRSRSFDRPRVVDLLRRFGRDEAFLNKTARDLSGGEIQVTALVRAVQLDPSALLLDEPTAALDAATAQAVEEFVINWVAEASDRRALVWVSHDPAQHSRVANTTLHIHQGRLSPSAGPIDG